MFSFKSRIFLFSVFLLIFTTCGFAEVTCQFQLNRGTASIVKSGTTNPVTIGTELVQVSIGDKLNSGPETRGNLTFPDGSVFRVKSDTILELQNEAVKLQVGETFFQVQKQGRSFQVVTPSSVCGVLGTSFDVNVNPMGSTRVRVFEGTVAVRNHQDRERRQILLKAGQMVEAQTKGPLPKAPTGFDPKKAMEEDRKSEASQTRDPKTCQGKASKDPRTCQQPSNVPGMGQGQPTANPTVCGVQGVPDPNMFPGKPTADPRACQGGMQPGMNTPGGPGTQEPKMCDGRQTIDPRFCQGGNQPGMQPGGGGGTQDPRSCMGKPSADPRSCQGGNQPGVNPGSGGGTQDPRSCMGKPSADPRSCQGGNQPGMQPGGGGGTQDPRSCMSKPSSDPRSCQSGPQPQGQQPPGPRPGDQKPQGQQPSGPRPGDQQPQGQQPSGPPPGDQKPQAQQPSGPRPGGPGPDGGPRPGGPGGPQPGPGAPRPSGQ